MSCSWAFVENTCPSVKVNMSVVSPTKKCVEIETFGNGQSRSIKHFGHPQSVFGADMTIDRILENTSAKVRFTCANGISYEVKIEGNDTSGIQRVEFDESTQIEKVNPLFTLTSLDFFGRDFKMGSRFQWWWAWSNGELKVGSGGIVGLQSTVKMYTFAGQNMASAFSRISRLNILNSDKNSLIWTFCGTHRLLQVRNNISVFNLRSEFLLHLFHISENGKEEWNTVLRSGNNDVWSRAGEVWRIRARESRVIVSQFIVPEDSPCERFHHRVEPLNLTPTKNFAVSINFGCNRGYFNVEKGKVDGGMPRYGQSVETLINVTLEQMYYGYSFPAVYSKTAICSHCNGHGGNASSMVVCPHCFGEGAFSSHRKLHGGACPMQNHRHVFDTTRTTVFEQDRNTRCAVCDGSGKIVKEGHQCPYCENGIVTLKKERLIVLAPGFPDNHKVILVGEGHANKNLRPGNLILKFKLLPHDFFTRRGNDLELRIEMSVKEALEGFQRNISHINGTLLKIIREGITPPGLMLRIFHAGMPIYDDGTRDKIRDREFGDLLIYFKTVLPTTLKSRNLSVITDKIELAPAWEEYLHV